MNSILKTADASRKVYGFTLFAALFLSAFSLKQVLLMDFRMEDLGMMCAAVKAELHGQTPYILSHLQQYTQTRHSFPYPPLALIPLKALCAGNPFFIYPMFCAVSVLGLWAWIRGCAPRDRWLLPVFLWSGFEGMFFLLRCGNIEVLNFILFGTAMGFLARNKIRTAGAFFGAAAFLKILPIAFAALFLIGKENRKDKISAAVLASAVFFTAHLASFLTRGDLYSSYFQLLMGQSAEHTPLHETFYPGWPQPSLLSLASLLNWKIIPGVNFFTGLFYAVPAAVFILMAVIFLKKTRSFTSIFSYGVLLMLLLMPRLKPYTYCLAVVPVYFLSCSLRDSRKTGLLAAAVFLPWFCRLCWPASIIFEYGQLYSLVLVYALLFFWREEIL